MDNKIDRILRSKYFSLFCALLNSFFAIKAAMSGSVVLFCLCGLFGAFCFKNYLNG